MPEDPRIDSWLDRWEQQPAAERLSPSEFAARYCSDAPAGLVQDFVRKAEALLSADRALRGGKEETRGDALASSATHASNWKTAYWRRPERPSATARAGTAAYVRSGPLWRSRSPAAPSPA